MFIYVFIYIYVYICIHTHTHTHTHTHITAGGDTRHEEEVSGDEATLWLAACT